jgi:predicted glycogen debranching enzyme
VPNRFPDHGGAPEYESVDASLWYVVALGETLAALARAEKKVAPRVRAQLEKAVQEILEGYAKGTRFGIRADTDGLLATGIPGQPLTWMDARVGGKGITPRVGKPVEIQALWINALGVGARLGDARWAAMRELARKSFEPKFWNAELGGLHDVVDVDHVSGTVDASVRPNQIFAVGGLPEALLEGKKAESVVDLVEDRLLTPLGLRTLAPDEPGYAPRYEGNAAQRDAAYHQGTVWPWLLGPFVEAWVRVHGADRAAILEARSRFLPPLEKHLEEAGLGHVSEILDGGPPHVPRGCPFQAWSVGEALRLEKVVLAVPAEDVETPRRRAEARPTVKARRR